MRSSTRVVLVVVVSYEAFIVAGDPDAHSMGLSLVFDIKQFPKLMLIAANSTRAKEK